jgi:outer membrane protein assembly factor BamB
MYRYLLGVVALAVMTGLASADDWPQWLGPKRDGVWREPGLVEKFPTGGPKQKWKVPVGIGYAGPAVAGGKVFLTDLTLAAGKDIPKNQFSRDKTPGTERVFCLDAATGQQLWEDKYPVEYAISYAAGPRCTPAVDGDRVYTLGAMGEFRCYTTAGKKLWSKNFPKDYDAPVPVWGFAAHPLIDGDKVICLAGGSDDRLVIAFNKVTGEQEWASQSCLGDFGYCPPMIYTLGGKRQLVIWHTRAIVGLDPENGKRLWRFDFDSRAALTVPTPRQVGDDQLYFSSFYHGSLMLKVGANKADVVWRSKAKGENRLQTTDLSSIMCTPVVEGEHIYGVCSYGELRCIKAATGERVWESMKATRGKLTPPKVAQMPQSDESERWSLAFLIPHGDRYFLFNEQGDLIIAKLSPKGYEEIDRARIVEPTNTARGRKVVWMHPAFADKCVFARNDRELVCVEVGK